MKNIILKEGMALHVEREIRKLENDLMEPNLASIRKNNYKMYYNYQNSI